MPSAPSGPHSVLLPEWTKVLVWSEDGSLREIQELRLPSDFKALQLSVDYHNCLDLARGRSGKWVRSSVTYGLPLDSVRFLHAAAWYN